MAAVRGGAVVGFRRTGRHRATDCFPATRNGGPDPKESLAVIASNDQSTLETVVRRRPDQTGETVDTLLLPCGRCRADTVAANLGITRRTLHRRMGQEHGSLTQLPEDKALISGSQRPLALAAPAPDSVTVSALRGLIRLVLPAQARKPAAVPRRRWASPARSQAGSLIIRGALVRRCVRAPRGRIAAGASARSCSPMRSRAARRSAPADASGPPDNARAARHAVGRPAR